MYYKAKLDDGHDTCYLYYESESRKGSQQNRYDCSNKILRKLGKSAYRSFKIVDCWKVTEEEFLNEL